MTLRLVLRNSVPASASHYRLLDQQGRELAWANNFLDAQRLRQLSLRSLRAYGYDLLHLARWLHQTRRSLAKINQSCLLDYVRRQLDHDPKPTPSTINHRLGVLRCLYRFHYGHEIPEGKSHFQRTYTTRSTLGYGRPQRRVARGLRLRQPHRVVVPLSADEVARFWKSFRTFRDLAIVALMLLDGLRSCEVLALQLEDLYLADAHLRVQGKGNGWIRNSATPTIYTPTLCCSSAPPESASASVSIFLWIACGRWGSSSGHFMSRSASSTLNASCQLTTTSGAL